eukprot:GFKZ01011397.1.p1 GENE.GFKZ01011397.1~~GFKZ01011397.1.p1  ORF type:complete len:139 (-),score=19.83 GFKZ01011397.1:32-448(-)
MASGAIVSGLDRLVEAVEAMEASAARLAQASREGFVCPHPGCERVFSKRYNQQAHMRIHDGTRPFDCNLCGRSFMWKSSLKSHAKMHAKLAAEKALPVAERKKGRGRIGKKVKSDERNRRPSVSGVREGANVTHTLPR